MRDNRRMPGEHGTREALAESNAALLAAASAGDQAAWDALVARFANLVWSVASGYRLKVGEDADAVQNTWLRLVENLDRITDPEHLGSWLCTTVRRECLQVLRRRGRIGYPLDLTDHEDAVVDPAPDLDASLLRDERDAALWRAVRTLPERCWSLLRVLMADPAPSYAEVSEALAMPVGSIGPTRQRCLEQLRRDLTGDPLLDHRADGETTRKEGPS